MITSAEKRTPKYWLGQILSIVLASTRLDTCLGQLIRSSVQRNIAHPARAIPPSHKLVQGLAKKSDRQMRPWAAECQPERPFGLAAVVSRLLRGAISLPPKRSKPWFVPSARPIASPLLYVVYQHKRVCKHHLAKLKSLAPCIPQTRYRFGTEFFLPSFCS